MQLILRTYTLKLRHTFTISRESHDTQPTLIVELTHLGHSGFGEATSNPYYKIGVADMVRDLTKVKAQILNSAGKAPEDFWSELAPHLKDNMFALCALDMAYNDLYSKIKGKKLYEFWNYTITNNPLTDYTIGLDSIEKMILKMKETPWPIYKIKLGSDRDIQIVTELRKHTDAVFRIDANCGWTAKETINNSHLLKNLGVEFIEQPLRADDWENQKIVFEKSVLPIIADESCQVEQDVTRCHGYFHGVNVKLVKCGGLTPARRMLLNSKKLGLKTMVGCMTESTVGISAISHLLPLLDYVDMDGALLLSEDIAEGVTIKHGKIFYSDRMGTGVDLIA